MNLAIRVYMDFVVSQLVTPWAMKWSSMPLAFVEVRLNDTVRNNNCAKINAVCHFVMCRTNWSTVLMKKWTTTIEICCVIMLYSLLMTMNERHIHYDSESNLLHAFMRHLCYLIYIGCWKNQIKLFDHNSHITQLYFVDPTDYVSFV